MRALILVLVNATLIATLMLWHPESLQRDLSAGGDRLIREVRDILYTKEIRFSGLRKVARADLMDRLPLEKSVIWWKFNTPQLESRLLGNPLISHAEFSGCDDDSWGCFQAAVSERDARYVVAFGSEVWLLGKDGGFIAPLRSHDLPASDKLRRLFPDDTGIVLVKGLMERERSPEVLEARINVFTEAIAVIEQKTGLRVKEVSVDENGDISLRFRERALMARFDFTHPGLERIEEQAVRLSRVMATYGARIGEVEQIDLAFEKMAVVKTKDAHARPGAVKSSKH